MLLTPILLPIMISLGQQTKQAHKHNQATKTIIYVFFDIPRTAFVLTQANYYRPTHKVPSAPSLRQKTPPIAGIVPSFENAENSQVCCPGGPSRHHAPSEENHTLCTAAPTAPSGPSVPLLLCDYDSEKSCSGFSNLYDLPFAKLFKRL